MDPVTTAIITAISAGAIGGVTAAGKDAMVEAYQALKRLLKQKFGGELEKAVTEVEANPVSKGRQLTLQEEVEKAAAAKDAETLAAAQKVLQLINPQHSSGNTFNMSGAITGGIQAGNIGQVHQNYSGK